MIQLTDTHCHLDFDAFDQDRPAVIRRAIEAGLIRILIPGIDLASSETAIQLAGEYGLVFAAVGFHPNRTASWQAGYLERLRELISESRVVAIGEIGLDYYRDWSPRSLQRQVFQSQLSLATECDLPVVIHNREASDDLLDILADWQVNLVESGSRIADRPGVLHSFSGTRVHARKALAHNFCIGITGPVTYKNAVDLQDLVVELPLESILIETDAPYLTPHPYRGKRNEPGHVQWVAEKIAELKGLEVEDVRQATTENATRLFQW